MQQIHDQLLERFLRYENPSVDYKVYKFAENEADNVFDRVVLVCRDKVFKIYGKAYEGIQQKLVEDLRPFFKHYPESLEFSARYEPNICWTSWQRVNGSNLSAHEMSAVEWVGFLKQVVVWWEMHQEVSNQLDTPTNYLWWHDDVTPWNTIKDGDKLTLVDWDDFCLRGIVDAKYALMDVNLQFARTNNQSEDSVYRILGEL